MFRKPLNLLNKNFFICLTKSKTKSYSSTQKSLGVIGVPFSKGQPKPGAENGPDTLRNNGLIDFLSGSSAGSLKIKDYGNLSYVPDYENAKHFEHTKNYPDFMGCNRALMAKVQDILKENDQILTIGGDHSIGFGSVAGHLQHNPNVSLIWVDAHADINLHSTSETGNIHGMPVSLLLKELRPMWKNANLEKIAPICLPSDQLVYIGLRDVDPYEAYILHKYRIKAYAMDSVDKYGIEKIMEMTLDSLKATNKIHVSFDVDALDQLWVPSTGTVVNAGLTLREGLRILERIYETSRLEGIDLVEVNPNLGTAADLQTTIASSKELLKAGICGYKRSGNWHNINLDIFHNTKDKHNT